jgi:hypothetical protein
MQYPGYLLNPGDLFQVDPERVLYATGAPKDKTERREGRLAKKAASSARQNEAEASEEASSEKSEDESTSEAAAKEDKDPKETLKSLLSQAKTIMSRDKGVLPSKKKQELRGFQKVVRSVLSKSASSTVLTENLESQFAELVGLLKARKAEKLDGKGSKRSTETTQDVESSSKSSQGAAATEGVSDELKEAFQKATQDPDSLDAKTVSELSEEEFDVLKRALEQMRDNPIDNTKPYATPWRPRDYMGAFAFIPRYLEVNHNICAAVYLRHPVARPGVAEVPSPFSEPISTAAFAWYLRRR